MVWEVCLRRLARWVEPGIDLGLGFVMVFLARAWFGKMGGGGGDYVQMVI